MVVTLCASDVFIYFHADVGKVGGDVRTSPTQTRPLTWAWYADNVSDVRQVSTEWVPRGAQVALRKMKERPFQFSFVGHAARLPELI